MGSLFSRKGLQLLLYRCVIFVVVFVAFSSLTVISFSILNSIGLRLVSCLTTENYAVNYALLLFIGVISFINLQSSREIFTLRREFYRQYKQDQYLRVPLRVLKYK